ncbi:hypothetical protein F8S09_10490 [Deinococcus sp. SDU3-2]|uniref:Uncharacterized protein n=1 Tax=Deinococcus terrestris TaxID=2651870 RepID=A0A7X1NWP5_9DEIO|nr:hypothetical protein [Deinococcus terrestris]MPY67115.1 hypothetical protein [Deinococcus terrestris]
MHRLVSALLLALVGTASAATLQLQPGQTGRLGEFTLTVLRVQDSRCRPDVQCIQAGELRASVLVRRGDRFALLHMTLPEQGVTSVADGWDLPVRLREAAFGRLPRLTFTDGQP